MLLICAAAFLVERWFSPPLTLPVDLAPGVTRSAHFRVGPATRYLVELEVERNMRSDDLLCLLGGTAFRPPCTIESVVDIQWTLRSGSQVVASGSSRDERGMGFGSAVTKTIGQFEGSLGAAYVLEVTSMLDGLALAPANPRIVVRVNPATAKGYHIAILLMAPFVFPVALFGLLWWIMWAICEYASVSRR